MAHPNEELLRRGYQAFETGDIDALTADWADDVEWISRGPNPLAGTYRGKDQVLGMLGKIAEISDGTFRLEVRKIMADDDCVTVLVDSEATIGGETIRDSAVHLYDIEDGKIRRGRFFFQDPTPFNEAATRESERRLATAGA